MRSYNASRTPNVTLGSKDAQGLTVEAVLQRLDRRLEASRCMWTRYELEAHMHLREACTCSGEG